MTKLEYLEGDELGKALRDMIERAERGTLGCVAFRLYKADGSWEDVALGGTEEEQEQALRDLRAGARGH